MNGQLYEKAIWTLACVVFVAFGLALGGCGSDFNGTGDAEAAERRLIETFIIEPDTFVLTTDSTPTIEVKNGTTVYTLTSDGTLAFSTNAFVDRLIGLKTGDIVIERPASGIMTLIRSR